MSDDKVNGTVVLFYVIRTEKKFPMCEKIVLILLSVPNVHEDLCVKTL